MNSKFKPASPSTYSQKSKRLRNKHPVRAIVGINNFIDWCNRKSQVWADEIERNYVLEAYEAKGLEENIKHVECQPEYRIFRSGVIL